MRSNADLVFIFGLNSIHEKKHIWETYFGFMPYEDFEQILSRYTAVQEINGKPRNLFLGINNAVRQVSRTDAMFWGKRQCENKSTRLTSLRLR